MFLMSLNGFPRKVIVSPGFGAGWSTWIGSVEGLGKFLGEHPLLVKAIEDGDTLEQPVPGESFKKLSDPLQSIVKEAIVKFHMPDDWQPYTGGLRDATVETVNGPYKIDEYDGSETLVEQSDGEVWSY